MFNTARDHVVQNVLPAYRDFFDLRRRNVLGENQVVRAAVAAAVALYHLREHMQHPALTRGALGKDCPDYALLGDIANLSKHKRIDRGDPLVTKAEQIHEIRKITKYHDAQGEYHADQIEACVTLDDGTERNVGHVLHNVMSMWCRKLAELGIMTLPNPEPPIADAPITRDQALQRQSPIEVVRGEERSLRIQMCRYNYQKGCSEPIDVTGWNFTLTVREPARSIVIQVELPGSDIPLDHEIPLSREEAVEYACLATHELRTQYAAAMLTRRPELQQKLLAAISEAVRNVKVEQRGGV